LNAEILDENRYLELNSVAVAAATDVEDELLSIAARARANGEPRV
jgi:alkylhydroperoxidase/carboxymuconolactone decarboxylase family protein YurZ